jgi:DNA-binding transcriptional LysR family regulator
VLRREGYVAVLAPGDSLAQRQELRAGDLGARRVLVDGTQHGSLLGRAALEHGATCVSVVDDKTVVAALGAAGAGIALLPELSYVPAGAAVVLPFRSDLPERTIALAWKAERLRTVGTLLFVKAVTAVAQSQRAREVVRSIATA